MKIVVDTNILISALIKKGLTRKIFFENSFEFFVPAYTFIEIRKHIPLICGKSNLSKKEVSQLVKKLFSRIKILNLSLYYSYISYTKNLITDKDDVPFIAAALCLDCPIWSEDRHFKDQNKIKIFTTKEISE